MRHIATLILVIALAGLAFVWYTDRGDTVPIDDTTSEDTTENDTNLINVNTPTSDAEVTSPITVTGEARGQWYFEASFPLVLTNWDGLIIAEGYATADGDWMTEDFVPFTGTIEYDPTLVENAPSDRGFLIFQKSNPSGLPEHDDAVEIPVRFAD